MKLSVTVGLLGALGECLWPLQLQASTSRDDARWNWMGRGRSPAGRECLWLISAGACRRGRGHVCLRDGVGASASAWPTATGEACGARPWHEWKSKHRRRRQSGVSRAPRGIGRPSVGRVGHARDQRRSVQLLTNLGLFCYLIKLMSRILIYTKIYYIYFKDPSCAVAQPAQTQNAPAPWRPPGRKQTNKPTSGWNAGEHTAGTIRGGNGQTPGAHSRNHSGEETYKPTSCQDGESRTGTGTAAPGSGSGRGRAPEARPAPAP